MQVRSCSRAVRKTASCLGQVSCLGGLGPAVAGHRVVRITAAGQLTDLSPCSGEFILGWVEFNSAVEVGQGLVIAPHTPVGFPTTKDGPGLVGAAEFDGAVKVGQGLV